MVVLDLESVLDAISQAFLAPIVKIQAKCNLKKLVNISSYLIFASMIVTKLCSLLKTT